MATVPDFVKTGSEAARIHSVIAVACSKMGLPWNEIFSSLGDEDSPLRDSLLQALVKDFCQRTIVLNEGECRFEAFHPHPHITFAQGRDFAKVAKLEVLSLAQIENTTGLKTQLRMECPQEWRVVDFITEREGKYYVWQVDKRPWIVKPDEYFGPNDMFIVKFEPQGSALKLTNIYSKEFLIFQAEQRIQINDLDKELKRYGCVLASEREIRPHMLTTGSNVFARSSNPVQGYYALLNSQGETTGWVSTDTIYILPGVYVFGKPYPNK